MYFTNPTCVKHFLYGKIFIFSIWSRQSVYGLLREDNYQTMPNGIASWYRDVRVLASDSELQLRYNYGNN